MLVQTPAQYSPKHKGTTIKPLLVQHPPRRSPKICAEFRVQQSGRPARRPPACPPAGRPARPPPVVGQTLPGLGNLARVWPRWAQIGRTHVELGRSRAEAAKFRRGDKAQSSCVAWPWQTSAEALVRRRRPSDVWLPDAILADFAAHTEYGLLAYVVCTCGVWPQWHRDMGREAARDGTRHRAGHGSGSR